MGCEKRLEAQAKPFLNLGVEQAGCEKEQNQIRQGFDFERRIGGADTEPVGTGEAFAQLRSGASPIRRGWDGGTRTHNIRVKVWCVTVTLRPTVIKTGDWDFSQSPLLWGG